MASPLAVSARHGNRAGTPSQRQNHHLSGLLRRGSKQGALTFDDRKSAEAFVAAIDAHGAQRALKMRGVAPTPRKRASKTELTVDGWVGHLVDHLTGIEASSIDKYDDDLRNDIEPFFGGLPLAAIGEEDLSCWIKRMETTGGRKGTGHARKTIANKYGFLSGALNAAVPIHMPANPAAGRSLRKVGRVVVDDDGRLEDDDIRMLSRDEYTALYAATTECCQPLVEFLVATGLRWGEAAALQPRHFDRDTRSVKIRQAWKYTRSKGYYMGVAKTQRSRCEVDVPKSVFDTLDLSGEWLFRNRDGGPVRYAGFKRRVWDKAVDRAELDPRTSPHALRHTYASWHLAGGTPITVVSRQLGHESLQVTVAIYGDVDRTSSRAAAEFMDGILD